MSNTVASNSELIEKYDRPGPRYTSYPPATQFSGQITAPHYRNWSRDSNEEPIPRPLSLYVHIPFCDTICYHSTCNKVTSQNRQHAVEYIEDLYLEIGLQGKLFDRDRIVQQLHWGGGTTAFLEDYQIERLIGCIDQHFQLRNDDKGEYSIEIDPRTTSSTTIRLLRDLGFNQISLGVHDFDPNVQKAINRIQSIEDTHSVFKEARKSDFKSINLELIYGLPLQTVKSFTSTLETLIEFNPDRITLYNYANLPSHLSPQRQVNTNDFPSAVEKLEILQLSIDRLSKAGYVYLGMDQFVKPFDDLSIAQRRGSLHRNFQEYSAHPECDSIALGISAISNIGNHYSQNTTDLKHYHNELTQNRLPIYRGYNSDQDDVMRHEIIQQLTCYHSLDIPAFESRWEINFMTYFGNEQKKLKVMEIDKLLELDEKSITVLEVGRPLVRNICMVFDRYNNGQSGDSENEFSGLV